MHGQIIDIHNRIARHNNASYKFAKRSVYEVFNELIAFFIEVFLFLSLNFNG